MSLQHVLLGLLNQKPLSGYDLNKSLKKFTRYFWEADRSRIYRTLNELCKQEWVTFETIIQESHPNKKIYTITELGRAELHHWLGEPGKNMEEKARSPLLVQLHFSNVISLARQRFVMEERVKLLREELRELEQEAEKIDLPIPMPEDVLQSGLARSEFTLAYGIERYQFEIDWALQLIRILTHAMENE